MPAIPSPHPLAQTLRLAVSVSRLHIVAIAALGLLTFGWIFTGAYMWALALTCALDWFVVNLLNRVVDQTEDQHNRILGADFAARHGRAITAGCAALLLASLVAVHLAYPAVTPLRLAYHALGLAYNWPVLPGRRRIKQLYFFKNTASTTGFMLTVFGYPLAATTSGAVALAPGVTPGTVLFCAGFFFLFEMSYEVIYDLRDREGDARAGVRTYPVVHGLRGAARIIDGLLLGAALVLTAGFLAGQVPWRALIMVCAPALQLWLYKRALRRGVTAADCTGLTWLGVALLTTYHLWVLLDLPGAQLG